MGNEVTITQQEAVDLLSKWRTENRVIHLTLNRGPAIAKIVGRIDAITAKGVSFSGTRSTYSLGKYNLAQFPLDGCYFEYSDANDAPEPLRSQLLGYDALLYVHYFDSTMTLGSSIGLAVLPVEEWTQF
jgi:hypothetical protein